MTPHTFLKLLWQHKPDEQYVLLWTLQDKRSHWFRDIAKAAEFAADAGSSQDVYIGMGLAARDYGPSRRCVSDEITGLAGVGSDFDLKSVAHGAKPLPASIPEALSIIPAAMPPSIVIATGNGAHAWWLLKEPDIFTSDGDRKQAARLVARWHTLLRLNAASRGWVYDRLSDLARVLRIPGTKNHKDPANRKDVVVFGLSERRYNWSDFQDFLDDAAIPDPEAEAEAAREWKERFDDKPLVIDPAARIPEDTLKAWMDPARVDPQTALKFRNTWNRQRHDLSDQSSSGYDLALADFGADAGLTEQQIVNLIIHHRAVHGQKQRTKVDYYQRTIAKAQERSAGRAADAAAPLAATAPVASEGAPTTAASAAQCDPVAPEAAAPNCAATPPAPPDPQAEARGKALLCQRISRALTIPVVRLVKITGKEPQYRMELADGHKIEFPTVRKLLSYDAVYDAIAATVGKCIPRIKAKHWDGIRQVLLDACIVVEGTEEMEWEGAARMYLQHYLAETGFIPSFEGQALQDQRRPMIIDGAITVCASELQIYINKTTFQALSVKAVAGMLSALGATSVRVRRGNRRDQSRWALPTEEFDPDEYRQSYETGGADAGK